MQSNLDALEKLQLEPRVHNQRNKSNKSSKSGKSNKNRKSKTRNEGSQDVTSLQALDDKQTTSWRFQKKTRERNFYIPEAEEQEALRNLLDYQKEDHIVVHVSEQLQQYMEFDNDMISKYNKFPLLPARMPVVTILEHWVKQETVKLVFANSQADPPRRRAVSQQNKKEREREFEKLKATVSRLKEVADGLRIYFDFALFDYLLYKQEKEYAMACMSDEQLCNFNYVPTEFLSSKYEVDADIYDESIGDAKSNSIAVFLDGEEIPKQKLHSNQSDDTIATTTTGCVESAHVSAHSKSKDIRSAQPKLYRIPIQTKDFMQSVLAWHLLPSNVDPTPSMIFGVPHLARLIVKLPDFLNANLPPQEKLEYLLEHLQSFTNYMESHEQWFGEDNYVENVSRESPDHNADSCSATSNAVDSAAVPF